MRILYYNLQLGSFDGSNSHAAGMLMALREACGEENVMVAHEAQVAVYRHGRQALKTRLGKLADPARKLRKGLQSRRMAAAVIGRVRASGFAPDVLLARATLYDTAPQEIVRELGCKLVVEANTPFEYESCDVRGISMRSPVRRFERRLLDGADGIYAVSDVLKGMLVEGYGIDAAKIAVVPNGYSRELYADFPDRVHISDVVRVEQGVSDAFVVVFVGSLQTWHGIGRLVEIAEKLKGRDCGREVVFWVLGDGPERDAVSAYAARNPRFTWFGNVEPEEMKRLLYAADLGIMPYDALERFYFSPLKMFDMVGAGLPFLGLDIGQIGQTARSSLDESFLVPSPDAGLFAKRVAALASAESGALASMRSGVAAVRSGMTWNVRAAALISWLGSI